MTYDEINDLIDAKLNDRLEECLVEFCLQLNELCTRVSVNEGRISGFEPMLYSHLNNTIHESPRCLELTFDQDGELRGVLDGQSIDIKLRFDNALAPISEDEFLSLLLSQRSEV